MITRSRRPSRQAAAGDIVVMKVAHHYNIGREEMDGEPIVPLAVKNGLDDALELAHRLVTGHQRVFLYHQSDSLAAVEVHCAKPY